MLAQRWCSHKLFVEYASTLVMLGLIRDRVNIGLGCHLAL
jgi:hypothetical protein